MALRKHPAYFTWDEIAGAYSFTPTKRRPPPYYKQIHVEAILDIAEDGTLAGVEILDGRFPPVVDKGPSETEGG